MARSRAGRVAKREQKQVPCPALARVTLPRAASSKGRGNRAGVGALGTPRARGHGLHATHWGQAAHAQGPSHSHVEPSSRRGGVGGSWGRRSTLGRGRPDGLPAAAPVAMLSGSGIFCLCWKPSLVVPWTLTLGRSLNFQIPPSGADQSPRRKSGCEWDAGGRQEGSWGRPGLRRGNRHFCGSPGAPCGAIVDLPGLQPPRPFPAGPGTDAENAAIPSSLSCFPREEARQTPQGAHMATQSACCCRALAHRV